MTHRETRAVVFDFNGTLSDMNVLVEQDIYVGKVVFGLDPSPEEVVNTFGNPPETFYPKLFGESGLHMTWQEMRQAFLSYDDMFPRRLLPEVLPTISLLRKSGLVTGVVTSGLHQNVLKYMQQAGLSSQHMDFVHTSREVGAAKARGLPILSAALGECAARGVRAEEMAFVGDEAATLNDARAAGVRPVVVASGAFSKQSLVDRGVPPTIILDTIGQLPDYLNIRV